MGLDLTIGGEGGYWLIPVASIIVGASARRWWPVLLPAWIPPVAALAWVVNPDPGDGDAIDSAGAAALFTLAFGTIPLAILTALSVAVAKLVGHVRRQRVSLTRA
jgi:hypothetical protein